MPNPIVHFEIWGSDGPRLQGFSRDLFGWKVDTDNEWQYGMVETGSEGGINGGIAGTQNGDTNRVTIYASIADPQAYPDKAERLGAEALMPVTDIGGMVSPCSATHPATSPFWSRTAPDHPVLR